MGLMGRGEFFVDSALVKNGGQTVVVLSEETERRILVVACWVKEPSEERKKK